MVEEHLASKTHYLKTGGLYSFGGPWLSLPHPEVLQIYDPDFCLLYREHVGSSNSTPIWGSQSGGANLPSISWVRLLLRNGITEIQFLRGFFQSKAHSMRHLHIIFPYLHLCQSTWKSKHFGAHFSSVHFFFFWTFLIWLLLAAILFSPALGKRHCRTFNLTFKELHSDLQILFGK